MARGLRWADGPAVAASVPELRAPSALVTKAAEKIISVPASRWSNQTVKAANRPSPNVWVIGESGPSKIA